MKYQDITPLVVIAFISLLGLYDLYVYLVNGQTVSLYIWEQSARVPLLPALLGTVMGHFYLDKNRLTPFVKIVFEVLVLLIIIQTVSAMVFSHSFIGLFLWQFSMSHTWLPFGFGLLFGHLYWSKSGYMDENGNWRKP